MFLPMASDPLAARARSSGGEPALSDRRTGLRATWGQLDALAAAWAQKLTAAGIGAGDRIALVEPAGMLFAAVLHACIRIGAAVVPLPARAPDAELERLVEGSAPRAIVRAGELELRAHGEPSDGALCLIYTSGTTGAPKPVRLTLANHRASARGCIESLGRKRGDSWLLMLSPHHVGGFAIFMRSVLYGQPVVTVPSFDVDSVIAALDEERPTLVSAVPSMLTRVLDAGGAGALGRPRAILVGGAPARDAEIERWTRDGLIACATYGMTETCSQVATVPPGRALELLGTSGFVHSQATLTVDEGVISVAGPVVSPDFGGRVVTRDLGRLDERGALVVTGRVDDVIVTGGEKVHPAEVEGVLRRHPAVRDVAVAGRPDRVYGMVLEALVVGDGVTADALVKWSRERLPAFKVPRRVRFVDSLPLNDTGKLRRSEL